MQYLEGQPCPHYIHNKHSGGWKSTQVPVHREKKRRNTMEGAWTNGDLEQ